MEKEIPLCSVAQLCPTFCDSVDCSVGEGTTLQNGTPLQYSCLENPMDGGAWWPAVHGVAESWTWLSAFTFTFRFHALEKEMATHSRVLAWRIQGRGSLVGCRLWGRTESDTTEATWQQQQQQTIVHQAPVPMGFSRQEYWSRLPFYTPRGTPLILIKKNA